MFLEQDYVNAKNLVVSEWEENSDTTSGEDLFVGLTKFAFGNMIYGIFL